jgi:hypothetical protein
MSRLLLSDPAMHTVAKVLEHMVAAALRECHDADRRRLVGRPAFSGHTLRPASHSVLIAMLPPAPVPITMTS